MEFSLKGPRIKLKNKVLTVSDIIKELSFSLLTLKRLHFLYSAVITLHFLFQYLPSNIIACKLRKK